MSARAPLVFIDYDGRRVEYETGELDEVSLAYATTVYKNPKIAIPSEHVNRP